ncbi:MAG TPA: hypothetical protein VMY34_01360 [Acidimicrobiales bacterium]|nr:hypothetical protein [Acidimicrobiales bacterium]
MTQELDPRSKGFIPDGDGDGGQRVNRGHRSWTPIGHLGASELGTVDPAGLVTPAGASWSIDWWIGADDRWHVPAREPSLRQSLLDEMPVVETRIRVPGGDAVQRVYGLPGPSERTVLEIENDSSVPFALALAIRPYGVEGVGEIAHVVVDGDSISIDGATVLLPTAPAHAAAASFEDGDVAEVVMAGDAPPGSAAAAWCRYGLASAAVVFPLPHRATLRIEIPRSPDAHPLARPLSSAADAGRGWRALGERGLRVAIPDERLEGAFAASRRHLLLRHAALAPSEIATVAVASALRAVGYDHEASTLEALAAGHTPHACSDVPALLDDETLVLSVRGIEPGLTLDRARAELGRGDVKAWDRLDAVLGLASPTWAWPDAIHPQLRSGCGGDGASATVSAKLVLVVCRLLVCQADDGGLELLPVLPPGWHGSPIEVHDAPLDRGVLSYAVRWHGTRPALLWDLRGAPPKTAIRCPGLDDGFVTLDAKGEALLGPLSLMVRDLRPSVG